MPQALTASRWPVRSGFSELGLRPCASRGRRPKTIAATSTSSRARDRNLTSPPRPCSCRLRAASLWPRSATASPLYRRLANPRPSFIASASRPRTTPLPARDHARTLSQAAAPARQRADVGRRRPRQTAQGPSRRRTPQITVAGGQPRRTGRRQQTRRPECQERQPRQAHETQR